jgi:hypothetical protein
VEAVGQGGHGDVEGAGDPARFFEFVGFADVCIQGTGC